MKILLRRSDVDPSKPDQYGRTPLSCAVLGGHEGVVKLLLEPDNVNPDGMSTAKRFSGGLLQMGAREWCKYCSDGTTSTPINQMSTAKHHSGGLSTMDTRE